MSDNIKILKNYLIYFLLMILVCMVGISNVFADTFENIGYLDDDSYVSVKVGYTSQQLNLTRTNQYQLSQVEEMYIEIENYNFQGGTTYSIEFYTPSTPLKYVNSFGAYGKTSSNEPVSCNVAGILSDDIQHLNFKFNCPKGVNYLKLNLFNSSNNYIMDTGIFQWNYVYLKKLISSSGNEIIESQNAQIIQGQKDIINNQTQNTQDIINNNNTNTNNIINNQNENNQKLIDEMKKGQLTCNYKYEEVFKYTDLKNQGYLDAQGQIHQQPNFRYSDPTLIFGGNTYSITSIESYTNLYYVNLYDSNMNWIKSFDYRNIQFIDLTNYDGILYIIVNVNITVGNNIVITKNDNICVPTSYLQMKQNEEQINAINGLNDSLNDDDSSGATSEASEFFNSFTTNTFGLTSIITAPLNLIQSLTSSTCSELHLPLPYLNNKYLDLPCMTSIYQTHFGSFFTMYQTITYGIIAYWVCVRIFNQVKDFKNPEHDEIEVVDL